MGSPVATSSAAAGASSKLGGRLTVFRALGFGEIEQLLVRHPSLKELLFAAPRDPDEDEDFSDWDWSRGGSPPVIKKQPRPTLDPSGVMALIRVSADGGRWFWRARSKVSIAELNAALELIVAINMPTRDVEECFSPEKQKRLAKPPVAGIPGGQRTDPLVSYRKIATRLRNLGVADVSSMTCRHLDWHSRELAEHDRHVRVMTAVAVAYGHAGGKALEEFIREESR